MYRCIDVCMGKAARRSKLVERLLDSHSVSHSVSSGNRRSGVGGRRIASLLLLTCYYRMYVGVWFNDGYGGEIRNQRFLHSCIYIQFLHSYNQKGFQTKVMKWKRMESASGESSICSRVSSKPSSSIIEIQSIERSFNRLNRSIERFDRSNQIHTQRRTADRQAELSTFMIK